MRELPHSDFWYLCRLIGIYAASRDGVTDSEVCSLLCISRTPLARFKLIISPVPRANGRYSLPIDNAMVDMAHDILSGAAASDLTAAANAELLRLAAECGVVVAPNGTH
jgi:hypothetical protein